MLSCLASGQSTDMIELRNSYSHSVTLGFSDYLRFLRHFGYVDLGELGVADRWWDVAVGAWSAGWNFGQEHEARFYEGYGIEPDPERIRFYRLLYDVVS